MKIGLPLTMRTWRRFAKTVLKEVRLLLRLENYYLAHKLSFSAISAPFSDLTKIGQSNLVRWGEAQEKAFITLQEILLRKPVLRLPDRETTFILPTDASDCGLGAALMQQHDDKLHPLAYGSKKLTHAERKYSTIEKECLAIVWGITKFRLFLAGKPFILQTDHKPLSFMNQAKNSNDPVLQWTLGLQGYDYQVQDIPSKNKIVADYYLSRIIDRFDFAQVPVC